MDIKKPTYRGRPTDQSLSFSWSWRPKCLEQLDEAIRLTTRVREVRVVRSFVLGLGIKVFREDPERWISYSRNKNWYRWAMQWRYWPVRNMYASMISAVDQLAAANLIENHIVRPGNLGEQSRFRATSKLMALVTESRISLILDRPEIIILRDADKRPISYNETRETGRMRRALEEYNRFAASLHLCVAGQKIIEGEPLVVGETCTGAATLQAYRMFNESFRFGGRLYGQSTQNIPKELRATITINDSATDEPDFPSLHPQLLYALVGRHLPHDPYDLDGWDRPTVKRAFNIMLNAKTLGSAQLAVAETIGGFTGQHREQAKRLIGEIEHKHGPVAEHFGSGMGLRLQRIDSDIAARVLAKSAGKVSSFSPFTMALGAAVNTPIGRGKSWTNATRKLSGNRPLYQHSSAKGTYRYGPRCRWCLGGRLVRWCLGGRLVRWCLGGRLVVSRSRCLWWCPCLLVWRLWSLLARSMQALWSGWSELPSFFEKNAVASLG